jgi:hypothetical protein
MRKSQLPVLMLVLALLPVAGCHHKDEKKMTPSKLAGGLSSGATLHEVEKKLGIAEGSYEVLEQREPLPSDTRPPYRLLVISSKQRKVFGQSGELVMTFFNDRLMTMQFYAADIVGARSAVEREQQLSLADGQNHIPPTTRVWVGKDENQRGYIGWIDKALQGEQDAWVRQYER